MPVSDEAALRLALRLAARGRYRTAPNPMVGAVVVRDGAVVGRGFHRRLGAPHAEVDALQQAGERSRGATLYVTLEPCCHHGRTPPCTDVVVAAGVARVVACHLDPDPRVRGEGFRRLRDAGIEVASGALAAAAARLNLAYLVPRLLGRPCVTLKWAMSLDGRIATATGESKWISSRLGRRWALALREEHDAVLVGSGTVLADDPRLDRRLGRAPGPSRKVVLDRRLRTPPEARLLASPGEVLLYTAVRAPAERRGALAARGATLVEMPVVEPPAVLADLARRGVASVLVEGGGEILAAFASAGCFDRVAVDCAPLLIGGRGAPAALAGDGVDRLEIAPRLSDAVVGRRGGDIVIEALRDGCLPDLLSSVAG